ncbi:MAG TPA: WD40 repeat domain-containing protein [Chitinophagales bacterium]|nr:WD40 repeat domain-containing protein [Chitinophagales bacterium]
MSLTVNQIAKLTLHQGSIYSLEKGENENYFFSGGSEGIVARWDVETLDKPIAVAKIDGQIFAMLFLPEKNHLLIGTMSGGLHVIDLNKKKELHYITFHELSIFDIKVHEGKVFVCSKDGTLSIWNAESYQLEKVITVSDQSLRMIAFHPEKNEAAMGSSDNKIYLLDIDQLQIISVLEGPDNSVFSVCYNEVGSELIAGSRDAQLYIYDLKQQRLRFQLKAHLYTINHLTLILGNKFVASASRDKTIRIWDAKSFELQKSLDKEKYDGHVNSVNKLLWLHSRNFLISASDDRSIIVWKIKNGN